MLVNEMDENSISNFLELFKKKFASFCEKAPLLLSFEANIEEVIVKELYLNKINTFKFDHTKDVKANIKTIKDFLVENLYPVMLQKTKTYTEYTDEELENIINESGIKVEQAALMKKETISIVNWRIEKVINAKNELFVRNLKTNKSYRFKLYMPTFVFLKKFRELWDPSFAYTVFEEKSQLLNELIPTID